VLRFRAHQALRGLLAAPPSGSDAQMGGV
jgi:hypothetical protein